MLWACSSSSLQLHGLFSAIACSCGVSSWARAAHHAGVVSASYVYPCECMPGAALVHYLAAC